MTESTIDDRLTPICEELIAAGVTLPQAARAFEQKFLVIALKVCRGNMTRTARKVGVHRNTVMNRLQTRARRMRLEQ